jgi:hypothetical protein
MGTNKSITVQIAPQDLDLLRKKDLILFVGRPDYRRGGVPHVWRTFDNLRHSHSFHWEADYATAASSGMAGTPDGPVALWFGPHAPTGSAVPSDAETIVVDLSAADAAAVNYADGRWSRIEVG